MTKLTKAELVALRALLTVWERDSNQYKGLRKLLKNYRDGK
jgi:hypothetical protein